MWKEIFGLCDKPAPKAAEPAENVNKDPRRELLKSFEGREGHDWHMRALDLQDQIEYEDQERLKSQISQTNTVTRNKKLDF